MLARYTMTRGPRPAGLGPLPDGLRQDTRKHTRHPLAPTAGLVAAALEGTDPGRFEVFAAAYRELLAGRCAADPSPFDALAARARSGDVFLGCSCPTARQPDVHRCHTVHALRFMAARYPGLEVELPADAGGGSG